MSMDAVKFFKEKKRMCKSFGEGCTGCMIHISSHVLRCFQFCEKYPEKAVDIVEEWSAEHPQETYLTQFLKHYPNARLDSDGTPICLCPSDLGLMNVDGCTRKCPHPNAEDYCKECWNTAIKEE